MVKVLTDRQIVTNSATQDREVKINNSAPFESASISNIPPTVVNDKDDLTKQQDNLKSTIIDNNTKEINKNDESNAVQDKTCPLYNGSTNDKLDTPYLYIIPDSTSGMTSDQKLNGEIKEPQNDDSVFEDVKESSYGDYIGGGDDSNMYQEDNKNNYETDSITQVDSNGTKKYNNSDYNPPIDNTVIPPKDVTSFIWNKKTWAIGDVINIDEYKNKTITIIGDNKNKYSVSTDITGKIISIKEQSDSTTSTTTTVGGKTGTLTDKNGTVVNWKQQVKTLNGKKIYNGELDRATLKTVTVTSAYNKNNSPIDATLEPTFADCLVKLHSAIKTAGWSAGIRLTDSYRTLESQITTRINKPGFSASPGTSKHGWGVAVDIADSDPNVGGMSYDTKFYNWLMENAPKYGIHNPPWARKGGSGADEPWHWELMNFS